MERNQQMVFFCQPPMVDGEKAANGVFASSVALIGIESDL